MSRKAIISIMLLATIVLMASDLAGAVVTFVGDPAVCAWSDNRDRTVDDMNAPFSVYSSIDVFVRGSRDDLLRKHWDGRAWQNWEPIEINVNGRNLPASSSPSVVQRGRDNIDVFTTDGIRVFRTHWDGRNWRSEAIQNMGVIIRTAPAAASSGPDKLDIFVIGTDGNLWHRSGEGYENFRWERGWHNLGRPALYQLRSSPDAASIGPGCIDVVVLTENGYYHKRYNSDNVGGGRWSEWTPLPNTQTGYNERAWVVAQPTRGAPNCAQYTYFFAVNIAGKLYQGDYHPSRTSALIGDLEDIEQDIEYRGIAMQDTPIRSAPAVIGYPANPPPEAGLMELTHFPTTYWTIFGRNMHDNTLWCTINWRWVPVPDSTPETTRGPVIIEEQGSLILMANNTNIPGSDYRDFDLTTADPKLCAQACTDDPTCVACTYVKPGYQGTNARCWLKNNVAAQVQDECCLSGVKEIRAIIPQPASAQTASMMNDTDLPGSDYTNLELATADPNLCSQMCMAEPQCRAWTYIKPVYQGSYAQCWLKSSVPNQVSDERCISGVKVEG